MGKGTHLVETLRSGRFRDSKTGKVLVKPEPPGMRVVEKGFGTCREISPADRALPKSGKEQAR
jgi:hypothetical protein